MSGCACGVMGKGSEREIGEQISKSTSDWYIYFRKITLRKDIN